MAIVTVFSANVTSAGDTALIRRSEALRLAESYVQHRWHSSAANVLHGKDQNGVEVHTPDRDGGRGAPLDACWAVNADNVGVAYKWGGNDTPASFDGGIKQGKAPGDVYTAEKRWRDDGAVSASAVGIDCSGFICRCWKIKKRYSTWSLGEICRRLDSPKDLQPADIMNLPHGHALMFVRWLDSERNRGLFYEAAPYSKTRASEQNVTQLTAAGFQPMRYRYIAD